MDIATQKPQTFVFFGLMGSGKGTQVTMLIDFLKIKDGKESVYAGTGQGFRKLVESGSYTGTLIKEAMAKGELINDFLTNYIVTDILVSSLSPEKHLFFDGYPRNILQSASFEKKMSFYQRDDVKIIYIEVGKEEATKRMKLRGRADDTDEGIAKRFDEYMNNVIPSMNYFKDKAGYTMYTINGEQSIEDVHKELIAKLGL
jgi:adenylate kinase